MIKLLRELIPNLKDRFSLAALFAILIYAIVQTLFLDREPSLYSYILIGFVSVVFLIMLWLVDPSAKPKELPPLLGRSVSFIGKMNLSQDVHKKSAELLGANVVHLTCITEFVVVGTNPSSDQRKIAEKFFVRQVSEQEWLDWIEKEVNRRLWVKKLYLRSKLNKIRNRNSPTPEKKSGFNVVRFRSLFDFWKRNDRKTKRH